MGGRLAWPLLVTTALVTVALSLTVVLAPAAPAAAPGTTPAMAPDGTQATAPTRPACPSGTGQVASHSELEIHPGKGLATVAFALADGCQDVEVSLASYRLSHAPAEAGGQPGGQAHEQLLYGADTGRFSAGEVHELTAAVDPTCYHHVAFVLGAPTERFEPGGSERERARTIASEVGGDPRPCAAPPTQVTNAPAQVTGAPATGTPGTPAPPEAPAPPASGSGGVTSPATATTTASTTTTTTVAAPPVTLASDLVAAPRQAATPADPAAAAAGPAAERAAGAGPGPVETLPFTGPRPYVVLLACGLVLLAGGALLLAGGAGRLVSGSRARARGRREAARRRR